jgi:hypothetical protein
MRVSSGSMVITLPDMELSLNVNGKFFQPSAPPDGTSIPRSQASGTLFVWGAYYEPPSYTVYLYDIAAQGFAWTSSPTDSNNIIYLPQYPPASGDYWWIVEAHLKVGNFDIRIDTQPFDLTFTP